MRIHCQAILLDVDGVLVDSNPLAERHWRIWAGRHGLDAAPILAAHHGRPTAETIREFAPHLDAEAEALEKESNEADELEGLAAYDGAARIMNALPRDRWAIVTSATRRTATLRLRHLGLPIPDAFVTSDDIQRGKPAPDPYLLAATKLSIDPADCVVIEDAPAGIVSGKSAGARVIAVTSTNPAHALENADLIVARLADVHVEPAGDGITIRVTTNGHSDGTR
jgi:sugar-phosphatase